MNKLIFGFMLLALTACGGEKAAKSNNNDGRPAQDELKTTIRQMDDSLKVQYGRIMDGKAERIPDESIDQAINAHLAFYHYYPEDAYAAECLDKVHQLYMQQKAYLKSVNTCDTLIAKYPSYKNMHEVLLDAASTYDYMLRDTVNARKYYEKLLKSKKIDKNTKQAVQYRMNHMHLSLEEMISQQ